MLQTSNPGLETVLDLPVSSAVIVIGALSPQFLSNTNSPSDATGVRGCLHVLTVSYYSCNAVIITSSLNLLYSEQ